MGKGWREVVRVTRTRPSAFWPFCESDPLHMMMELELEHTDVFADTRAAPDQFVPQVRESPRPHSAGEQQSVATPHTVRG